VTKNHQARVKDGEGEEKKKKSVSRTRIRLGRTGIVKCLKIRPGKVLVWAFFKTNG